MRFDRLKPDVTLENLRDLVNAMLLLRARQADLHESRVRHFDIGVIRFRERGVGLALDAVWEAQQRCLES